MKLLKFIFLLGITLTFTFCSINDSEGGEDPYEEVINEQEQTILDANLVFNNMIIEGATIINDTPPTPNGNINHSLINTSTATIDEGFDISFNTIENIAGAYLIITDADGNMASSYFDIPESALNNLIPNNSNKLNTLINYNDSNKKSGNGDYNIIVNNFLESLSNGVFCYEICVYDNNGNISLPTTQCVTIETLGGNDFMIDRWYLYRFEDYGGGSNIDVGLNEQFCESEITPCENGNTINLEYCSTINTFYIDFYENGTYRMFFEENNSDYDYSASTETCTQVSSPDYLYQYDSEGIWAYNETNGKLFMAEYFSRSTEDGEVYEEFYGAGNAQLLFDSPITINGNTFILSFYEDNTSQINYSFEK